MGDWVLQRLGQFGIDITHMQRCQDHSTSCSIVTTRPDGARPALHKHGATGGFFVEDDQIDQSWTLKSFTLVALVLWIAWITAALSS